MKFGESTFDRPRYERLHASDFRFLVEDLIKNSKTFADKVISVGGGEKRKINVLDVIDGNVPLSYYVGEHASDKKIDAVNCLIDIYDELKKRNTKCRFY